MNAQEEQYFNSLSEYRAKGANLLEEPYMRGVKTSMVEKYSDQAHFIYELLQNADDAGATSARFDLKENELVFAHNGTRRFSISNPETEEFDSNNGKLGDINAITSIANSNKTASSIGKFGVGFKAVFQYTSTPRIYDPDVAFRIERFIVPIKIDNDNVDRKEFETLFVFPFDHTERGPKEAFEDISDKLRNLDYPLLFLSSLKNITIEYQGILGLYGKSLENSYQFDDTVANFICLTQNNDEELYDDTLWLFSRKDEYGRKYSVGFFVDDEGNLIPKSHSAFCYFPTKETTELNFIIHAPFLLTDSREGIKAGEQHNKDMIKLLAELSADSIVYLKEIGLKIGNKLINDNIFSIIPYDKSVFNEINDKKKISFKPFYTAIKSKFESNKILPAIEEYASKEEAYWAAISKNVEIFSDKHLSELVGISNAKWVFTSYSREEIRRNKLQTSLLDYIDSITQDFLDEDKIINRITKEFIENQSVEWLHEFYNWIDGTSGRKKQIKTKPIFLNQNMKAVSAFDSSGQAILFLPVDGIEGYETINSILLENDSTLEFVKQLGIEEPSLWDEIYNVILPQYKRDGEIDTDSHFLKFFNYYMKCSQEEVDDYIDKIRDCEFVSYSSASDKTVYRGKASDIYMPNENLIRYFESKPDTKFVEINDYKKLIGTSNEKYLISFLTELGLSTKPRVLVREIDSNEAYHMNYDWSYATRYQKWSEYYIDGCKEMVKSITSTLDMNLSLLLWSQLLEVINTECYSREGLSDVITGVYRYFHYYEREGYFESTDSICLRTEPWLCNSEGIFVSAKELSLKTLHPQYNYTCGEARKLLQFLSIEEENNEEEFDNLTDEQRVKIELADSLYDIPPEEIKRFAEQYRAKKKSGDYHIEINEIEGEEVEDPEISPIVSRVAKEIKNLVIAGSKKTDGIITNDKELPIFDEEENDEDDYTKSSIDFSKKIEQEKQRSAKEIENIAHLEELTQKALNSEKYTFGWFKAVLELESLNSGETNSNSREISISFSKVELEEGTSRTLILKHPNRYIPQFMEDLADIPLQLNFKNQPMIKVAVEVVNIKSYTLRVKLKTNAEIEGVDLSLVTEAKIEAKNPVFLIEELRKQFNKLDYDDEYNMQTNLCENIEFIFGPPGTGKTTHLAREIILPLMCEEDDYKVLVLTPTNKASDVLVRRLMDEVGLDNDYLDWLVRFGATNDNIIEQSGIFRDKTFDIRNLSRNVTVTTIARFPYDYFMPDENTRLHLHALKWDFIIIDEASMIPLANIIFPLYKKTPKKFIIAGDPFQIEPITTVSLWENENIFTIVKLKSFTKPSTFPHNYHVELLTTQYRSIPAIGEVFSQFAYDGVLRHNRTNEDKRSLKIDDFIDVKAINIIKFPVSRYESIYRPKKLQNKSNYQIYSALFAFEFVKYLSSLLELVNEEEFFRIGLIAPYRAQADLVDKLMSSYTLTKNVDIQVGTIHGFQGDECDIIIALFNPPPFISNSQKMFLNKLNIINVSISRARDYLFVIMPDDDTENVDNLTLIKKVEKICKEQKDCIEQNSNNIEELIFGSKSYLEDNSFSTSHQLVNVYKQPEKRYEVRSEDNAVDVQIHE